MEDLVHMLSTLEGLVSNVDEHDISSTLRRLVPEGEKASGELLYEIMAFDFSENNEKDELGWGTYFGPMMIWNTDEGLLISPAIQQVDKEVIEYWKGRAAQTTNALLKARYFGLVWDMEKKGNW